MNLEWSRLRILDAVARTGSVTQAAVLLHLTGPAVSQQLRRIEVETGTRVVVPDGRGVRLTRQGRLLADYAARVAGLLDQAEKDLHHGEELVGRLDIGALATIIRTLLVDTLPSFQHRHPRVELRLEDGETSDQLDQLSDGRLELVFAESWNTAPLRLPAGVKARQVERQPAWIALPEQHRLRTARRLDLTDLAAESWATCARDADQHRALTQLARRSGVELDVRHFVADPITQLALVRAGLAVACIPATGAAPESPGVAYRRLSTELHRETLLLTSDRAQSRPAEALLTHLSIGE